MSPLRRSMRRRRIRPSLKRHRLQRAEFFPASSPTSRYGGRSETPRQHPQSLTHLRGRQSDRRMQDSSKLPRNSRFLSDENAPVAARVSTKPRQASGVQSPRVAATVQSKVVGDSGVLPVSAKAKRRNTIAISRDDVRAKPLPDDQRSAIEAKSPATLPSRADDRLSQGRKRTIMARYVFGDELKPGERWKRRLVTMR